MKKSKKVQTELPLLGGQDVVVEEKTTAEQKPSKEIKKKPATELMKTVAMKTLQEQKLKKVFSESEIADILLKRDAGEGLTKAEHVAIHEKYRALKRRAKELEKGNQSRLIIVPSISQGGDFYKLFDFSALYYVYRLADRMGRNAKLLQDNDRFSKMLYAASLVNIDKFVEQFKRFEGSENIEIAEDGIYLLTLKRPLSDDEVGELRMIEETRRERLHNVLKPKAMEPAVFQAILMVVRQVAPRVRKLEKHYYYAIGEEMLVNLNILLARYFDLANGLVSREEAEREILRVVDSLFAGLAILSETRVWDYGVAAMIGENVNELRRLINKDLNVKMGRNG